MPEVSLDASARELARALAAREVGALELTDAAIARIEARDGRLNAVVVRDFDRARDAARAADERLARGERDALLGVPMTVKESHNVAGLPTTWGFPHARDWIAPRDGTAVARLKAAGVVILGKTNVPLGLSDVQAANPIHGRTHNPWDLSRTPGGSSGGGAAAVAAGMVPLEFGSDLGGSIRVPAAFCGVYGHKPSFGIVPTRGHAPPGTDGAAVPFAVVGPLARTPDDLELALDVTAGPEADEAVGYRLALPAARHARLADFRVLLLDHHPMARADAEVRGVLEALADRLANAGCAVRREAAAAPDLARASETYLSILLTLASLGVPGAEPMDAHRWIGRLSAKLDYRRAWTRVFAEVDVVLAPVFATPAFPHIAEPDFARRSLEIDGELQPFGPQMAWLGVATLGDLPVTTAPIGRSRSGLPIGAQVIGPYLEDRTPLRFAALMEQAFGGFVAPPAA